MAPWTRPIFDVLREYFDARQIEGMIEEGIIEIAPLAYMRGRTFKNAFILADEMQNATQNQMKMLLTRLGEGSQMAVTGDLAQADRLKDNGLIDFTNRLVEAKSSHIDIVNFGQRDIERHDAVKEVLQVYGDE
jgi:phosphate starvation-inducible PhoH-like protein